MKKDTAVSEHSQSSSPSVNAMCAEVALRNYLAANLHKLLSGKGDAFPSGSLAAIIEKETACGLLLEACKAALPLIDDAREDALALDPQNTGYNNVAESFRLQANAMRAAINTAQGNSGSGDLK